MNRPGTSLMPAANPISRPGGTQRIRRLRSASTNTATNKLICPKWRVACTGSIHSNPAEQTAVAAHRNFGGISSQHNTNQQQPINAIWQSKMETTLAHHRPTTGIQVKIIAANGG